MLRYLRNISHAGILDGKEDDVEHGGPYCVKYVSHEYKFLVSAIMIPLYLIINKYYSKDIGKDIEESNIKERDANFIEKFFGYLSIIIFFLQCIYKGNTGQLLFILNPCHMINLVEAYLLICRNTLSRKKLYFSVMNLLFSPFIALFFPVTLGLTGLFEKEMFWIEHYLSAIINPLILSFSGRYYTDNTISFKNHLMGHCLFALYQRVILFPISLLTDVNMNYTLCPSEKDPIPPIIGIHYYYISDLYIFIIGHAFHRIISIILMILKKIEKIFLKSEKEKNN